MLWMETIFEPRIHVIDGIHEGICTIFGTDGFHFDTAFVDTKPEWIFRSIWQQFLRLRHRLQLND